MRVFKKSNLYKVKTVRIIFLLFCIPPLLVSCNWFGPQPSFEDDYITYTIPLGSHETEQQSTSVFKGKSLRFQALFDSSSVYAASSPENQFDINKLMGFSDCSSLHHQNSARFGWNWYDGALHIFAYTYVNGDRIVQELGTAEISKPLVYEIHIQENQYRFVFNGQETIMKRHCTGGAGLAYNLYPYFGGDETAPHEIKIKIRFLE